MKFMVFNKSQIKRKSSGFKSNCVSWALLIITCVMVVGAVMEYKFLPETEFADGFAMQVATASALVTDGDINAGLDESWLPLLHIGRLVAVTPFLAIESIAGAVGPLVLLVAMIWPLTRVPGSQNRSLVTLLPLALPLLVSGRSVLVAVGVGYVVMHLLERRQSWMLWVGAILANLSSASVLMVLIVIFFGERVPKNSQISLFLRSQRSIVFGLLMTSFVISVSDKFVGFGTGNAGYESHAFASDNVLLVVLSRSTLLVSIVEGQYLRAFAYSAFALLVLIRLAVAFSDPSQRTAQRIVLCCVPGLLMEGLGVMAMVFPMIWLLRGFVPDSHRKEKFIL